MDNLKKLSWTTKRKRVKNLIPYKYNPRNHTASGLEKLRASLEKFDLVEIPVVDTDGTVVAGHKRLLVMMELGRGNEVIDVRVPNRKLTEEELKEYNLRSNIQIGIWDTDMLSNVFSDIDLEGIGFDLSTIEIPDINIDSLSAEEEGEVDMSEPPVILTQTGDIYELHSQKGMVHRIICGDCTNEKVVGRLMAERRADMVFTDPPYNVSITKDIGGGKSKNSIRMIHQEFKMASGEMTEEEFIAFLKNTFKNYVKFSKNASIHYICMDWKHIYELITAGREAYSEYKQLIVWNKDNGGMGTFYRSKHELIFVFKNGKGKHTNNFQLGQTGRYRTNVWDYPMISSFKAQERENNKSNGNPLMKLHPTVKPLEMVADAILDCSNEDNTVADFFIGSGTTLIACELTGRSCCGSDISEMYCDVTVRRYIQYMQKNNLQFKIFKNGIRVNEQDYLQAPA